MPRFGQSFSPAADPPNMAWYADLYTSRIPKRMSFIGPPIGRCRVVVTYLAVSYSKFVRSFNIVGSAFLVAEECDVTRRFYLEPFNELVVDGSHLFNDWACVCRTGVQVPRDNLRLSWRETLDHIRAWGL